MNEITEEASEKAWLLVEGSDCLYDFLEKLAKNDTFTQFQKCFFACVVGAILYKEKGKPFVKERGVNER